MLNHQQGRQNFQKLDSNKCKSLNESNHHSNESILSRSSEIGQKVIRDSNHDSDSYKHYQLVLSIHLTQVSLFSGIQIVLSLKTNCSIAQRSRGTNLERGKRPSSGQSMTLGAGATWK